MHEDDPILCYYSEILTAFIIKSAILPDIKYAEEMLPILPGGSAYNSIEMISKTQWKCVFYERSLLIDREQNIVIVDDDETKTIWFDTGSPDNCELYYFLIENEVAPTDLTMRTLEYAKSWDSHINNNHIYIEPWKAEVAHMLNSWKVYFT